MRESQRESQRDPERTKGKRKIRKSETVDELVTELQSAEETIADFPSGSERKVKSEPVGKSTDQKREELIKASEDGYVTQKVEYLKKSSSRVIDKIYRRFEAKREREANLFLSDLVVSQFSSMLGGLDAIENPKVLTDELKSNSILKKDIENIISFVSPYIPLIGLLGGVAIVGKHIYQHTYVKSKAPEVPPANIQIQSDGKQES